MYNFPRGNTSLFSDKIFEWKEQRLVAKRFYGKTAFRSLDQMLLHSYQKKSPYQISKEFLIEKKAQDIYMYGETPLTTMAKIVEECQLTPSDHVIEMGAGRGRSALFLAEYLGCRVTAYEQIPEFVEKMVETPRLEMREGDMFAADFSKASAIYLYGTMLSDHQITGLIKRFPKHCKIITVSYPLRDYSDNYQTRKTFSGRFAWGNTEVYWNERTC